MNRLPAILGAVLVASAYLAFRGMGKSPDEAASRSINWKFPLQPWG